MNIEDVVFKELFTIRAACVRAYNYYSLETPLSPAAKEMEYIIFELNKVLYEVSKEINAKVSKVNTD